MPSAAQLHIDTALSNFATGYKPTGFVARDILPVLGVNNKSDNYFKVDPNATGFRRLDVKRADDGPTAFYDISAPDRGSYRCDSWRLKGLLSDAAVANAQTPAVAETKKTQKIIDAMRRNEDLAVIDALIASASVTKITPSVKWNNESGDIVGDIKAQFETVSLAASADANAMVVPMHLLVKASETASWKARVKDTISPVDQQRIGLAAMLAHMVGIDPAKVFISRGFYNSAAQGAPKNIVRVWGDRLLYFYWEEPSPDDFMGLGVTFKWNKMPGSVDGYKVERGRDEDRESDLIYVGEYIDMQIVNPVGVLFQSALE